MIAALQFKSNEADRRVKQATEGRKAFRQSIKSKGMKLRNWDRMQKLANDETGEYREQFLADLKESRRLMQLARIPTGHQFDLVDAIEEEVAEEEGQEFTNPHLDGRQAYMNGEKPLDNPHTPNSADYQEWARGYNDMEDTVKAGQEMIDKLEAAEQEPDLHPEDDEEVETKRKND